MALHADIVMGQSRAAGVAVTERAKMHQKAAIIDRAVVWEGSLNILSHRDTGEQRRRLPYAAAASELIRVLDLDDIAPSAPRAAAGGDPVLAAEPCPLCGGALVVRASAHGAFLSCADGAVPGVLAVPGVSPDDAATVT